MKPRAGVSRRAWWALAVLPVLAWVVLLVTAAQSKPEIPPTGDALFDETIRLFSQLDTSGIDFAGLDGFSYPVGLEAIDTISGWESRFGTDPRYWLLKYCAIDLSVDYRQQYGEAGARDDVACLEEARQRGVADATVLLKLLSIYKYDWIDEQPKYNAPREPVPQDEAYLQRAAMVREDWDYILEHHGAEYRQLVSELLECGGGRAETHYYLAQLAAEQGDFAAAFGEYAAGNRLDGVTRVVGFPFDDVYAYLRTGQPLPDDYAFGSLAECEVAVALPNYIRLKDCIKLLVADAVARQDLQALDELHTFACRMGLDPNASRIHALVAIVLIGIIEDSVANGLALSAEQAQALGEIANRRQVAKGAVSAAGQGSAYFNGTPFQGKPPSFYLDAVLSRAVSIDVDFKLNGWLAELQSDQAGLAGPVRQAFEGLAAFDYGSLGWEP